MLIVPLLFVRALTALSAPAEPEPEPTATATPTATAIPTSTPSPTPTNTPSPTPTITPSPTPTNPAAYTDWAVERFGPPWAVNCENDDPRDGFKLPSWANGFCVPGLVTRSSQWFRSPNDYYGLMSSYADGVMEAQVAHRGYNPNEVEGVALMSCDYIGETVWLRPYGSGWSGPFKVVDCSGRNHIYYHMVGMGLAVEVSNKQAKKFGALVLPRVDVHIGSGRPGAWSGVRLADWWVANVLEWEMP